MDITPTYLATAITAIGALGTAAFGLVDATKAFGGGISNSGFAFIAALLSQLAPNEEGIPADSAISRTAISDTLRSNWLNGAPVADQKSVAKSLIKLRLNVKTAAGLARVTGVDPEVMESVADSLNKGKALTPDELNVYGRFDLLLSSLIDRAYQRADQRYRNACKVYACLAAVILAEAAAVSLSGPVFDKNGSKHYVLALITGLLATPLAPMAKDLAGSLTTAAKALQAVKR
ncbi:hypothetical protein [Geothrix sp. PMB-07]|uniref:hypothetical protein n=1 Tax=Geothrix sp. PMB-07 TaxID=3068640 RepID=UPI00274286C7|nr:hypothetical protein [Geothrix sp. PMB-07]WLT30696.1 hypothetical protein Q9293_13325 [Geothrix sp. PMB-07]